MAKKKNIKKKSHINYSRRKTLSLKNFLPKNSWILAVIIGLVLLLVSGSVFILPSKKSIFVKEVPKVFLPTNTPSPTVQPSPTDLPVPTLILHSTPLAKKTTISGKYVTGDDFYFAGNFKATVINKNGQAIYETRATPIWEVDVEPGEYIVRINIPSGFREDVIACNGGQCQSVSNSGSECASKFTIQKQDHVEVYCKVTQTDFSVTQAYSVESSASGPPEVNIQYPGSAQAVELEGTNYICFTESPKSNGKGLARRTNINHSSWSSYSRNDLPCFNAQEGQNSIEAQYRNEAGYETSVIQREFFFHRK